MAARPSLVVVLVGAFLSLGASYRTQNFVVEAPTPEIAQRMGQYAEHYRKEKALQWLGREMPPWGQPCPLRVSVTMGGSGGATSFAFDHGAILSMDMHIEGRLDRLYASVLPHEVTHTVLAHYFRSPVPRWADEGGAVLSEDEQERARHDLEVRRILNTPGRAIPLRRLFTLREYPRDVMVLYAEGYSVTNFLVGRSSRPAFLAFLAHGMRGDWDGAVRTHYGFRTVEELERAWVEELGRPSRPPATLASAYDRPGGGPAGTPAGRVVVRQTIPPAQPLLGPPQPIYRGAAPAEREETYPAPAMTSRPAARPAPPPSPSALPVPPPPVRLGAPQYESP
jgi:hypothetical protein